MRPRVARSAWTWADSPPPVTSCSWAKLAPAHRQSGAQQGRAGRTGKGNPYLSGVLGEAAAAAARTDTFLGERYRRIVKRRGKLKALVAVARSILVIIWQLLASPDASFNDLGPDWHQRNTNKDRRARSLMNQLRALHPDADVNITIVPGTAA